MITVPSKHRVFAYDPNLTPVVDVDPGSTVTFVTEDARCGSLLDRPRGVSYRLPLPTPGAGNPVTGPVAVTGAEPGDAIDVRIDAIELDPVGWCGAHAHVGPVPTGRVPDPVGRTVDIGDGTIRLGPALTLPVRAMVGCVGTAPFDGPWSTALPGRHGGNMDQSIIAVGTRVLLPVYVRGALVAVGDLHASQGDGELSGVGLEVGGRVTTTLNRVAAAGLQWPWAITSDRLAVLVAGDTFEEARTKAVDAMMTAIERSLDMTPGEALALLSIAGDLRIGQSYGAGPLTLRLEVPLDLGVSPLPTPQRR